MMRGLALAHFAWGVSLLLLAAWFATSALRILPHMSTGTIWTNLPTVVVLILVQAGPFGALGAWAVVLGRWTWGGRPKLRAALLVTHGILLLPGSLAVAMGINSLRAAARSAAGGGGLLSPLAIFPLMIGACVLSLALCSIAFSLTVVPKSVPIRN